MKGSGAKERSVRLLELSGRVKSFIAGFMCASERSPESTPLVSTTCSLKIQSCKEVRQREELEKKARL